MLINIKMFIILWLYINTLYKTNKKGHMSTPDDFLRGNQLSI